MPPSYLFQYSLVIRKTRLEEETLISPISVLEEKSGKQELYFLKHNKPWLNVDQSLNMHSFYEDGFHLIKEGNELLGKKIMAFYKKLLSEVYDTPYISYKNMPSFSYYTDKFPPLPSNGASDQLTSVYIPVKPQEQIAWLYPFLRRLIHYCLKKKLFVCTFKAYMFPLKSDDIFRFDTRSPALSRKSFVCATSGPSHACFFVSSSY